MFEVTVSVEAEGLSKDLTVSVDPEATAESLYAAVREKLPIRDGLSLCIARSGALLSPVTRLGDYQLRHGDQLVEASSAPTSPAEVCLLRVVDGPEQGRVISLDGGETVVGRGGSGVPIAFDDSAVSRRHAAFTLSSEGLTVQDLASTNGTEVDDARIEGSVRLREGNRVRFGDTVVAVETVTVAATGGAHLAYDSGTVSFNRPPRVLEPDPARSFHVGAAPQRPEGRRFPYGAALIPVLMGVVVWLLLRNPIFLLFTAMGPLMAVYTFVDDHRTGRGRFRRDAGAWREKLDALGREIEEVHQAAVRWREAQHPGPADLSGRARAQSQNLWWRRPRHPDFADVRVGVADQTSRLAVEVPDTGDAELADRARAVAAAHAVDRAVPVVLRLSDLGVVGVAGPLTTVAGLARWITVQLAAAHSPNDLALAVLTPEHAEDWDWAKWLPHTRAAALGGSPAIAAGPGGAATLLERLRDVVAARSAGSDAGGSSTPRTPHTVVLVQPPLPFAAQELSPLLDVGPQAGVTVVWLDHERSTLPGECRAVVEIGTGAGDSSVTWTDTGQRIRDVALDTVSPDDARQAAVALAPLRDVSRGDSNEIPERVGLLDLMPVEPNADAVVARWATPERGLYAVVGADGRGPVEIDLRTHGPHGLVAGTTGSGKSELLQTLVASLALNRSPERVNFVLVDYGGGTAFKDCVHLPHTVGFVTDLDEHLAQRALTSLDAELKRRERLLRDVGAKDVTEMEARASEAAPPSLVIVIDEFAALKADVPEFVDGIVDVAQRGRKLGVHLLLATQKPGGVISPNIQANTSLRVALRVEDAAESADILDRPDAARIPKAAKGRAFLKTGPSDVLEFQSAYVGGTSPPDETAERVAASTFKLDRDQRGALARAARAGEPTDLERIVEATRGAWDMLGAPQLHRPWLGPLPETVAQPAFQTDAELPPGLKAVIGLGDEPTHQRQGPAVLDVEHLGSVLIYGTSGAGKTTLLRTIATDMARGLSPDELHFYGLDFAGRGLDCLDALPHCGGVIHSNELDRVRKLLDMLRRLVDERRGALGRVSAASPSEYRSRSGEPMPYVVVLLDGFGQFWSVMEPIDRGVHVDSLARMVGDGRGVGLHFVMSADHRGAVPPIVSSTVSGRVVMRLASADDYHSLDLPQLAASGPPPTGRAFLGGGLEVQVAVLGDPPYDGAAQAAAFTAIGHDLSDRFPGAHVPEVRLLPDSLPRSSLPPPAAGTLAIPIGIDDTFLEPVAVDLVDNPVFLVVGPDRSGRSTALATLLDGLHAAHGYARRYLLGARRTPLVDLPGWSGQAIGVEQSAELAKQVVGDMTGPSHPSPDEPVIVVIEDADEFTDAPIAPHIETLVRRARDAGIVVLVSMSTFAATRSYTTWVKLTTSGRHGLLLQPDLELDGDVFGLRLPARAGLALPPGRGFLVASGRLTLVQAAS